MKIGRWVLGGALLAAGAVVLLNGSRWHHRFVDATARKPSGRAGSYYRDPKAHHNSFELLLEKLRLTSDDTYLDICCGGGALLERALRTVRSAAGLDHSADMVALTSENNAQAFEDDRLDVRQGDAAALPWDDGTFDAASSANALFFLPEPLRAFREAYRVLKPGGRFAVATAPKRKAVGVFLAVCCAPWASSMSLYTDEELAGMLEEAGFSGVEAYPADGGIQIGYGVKE